MLDLNTILNNITSELIVLLVTGILLIWKRIIKKKKAKEIKLKSLKIFEEPLEKRKIIIPYKQAVSKRFQETLEMLHIEYDNLSISKITEYLGYESVSEIEDYFNGVTTPPFDFLKKYADYFGLEYEWLKEGTGRKFLIFDKYLIFPKWYVEDIANLKPESIIFVRSTCSYGHSGIVLQLTKHKFIILPITYHISSNVGGTGQSQIESFYDLILEIYSSRIYGMELDKDLFFKLFSGEIYPKILLKKPEYFSHWWDDFLDITHKHPISESYEVLYGIEFIKAQEIVRWKKGKSLS